MTKMSVPIVVGVAQYTQSKTILQPLDPINLMAKTCHMAITDSGIEKLKDLIDSIYMVNINSWSYKDAPGELSKLLGINPVRQVYLSAGGESPQMLVNRAAKAIASGESKAILITGGEAAYSVYRKKAGKIKLDWPRRKDPEYMEKSLELGAGDFENKYRLFIAVCAYAMFETAVRAGSDRTLEEHNQYMGKILEHYSKIASKNPYAWSQKSYTVEEIITPTSQNRKINYPYTKLMCANIFVDQSASMIMVSEEVASELKIDRNFWVYLRGRADLKNIFSITQRPQLNNSPAAREGSRFALNQAGLKLEDIDVFDIYSCFPSMVQIIRDEIGLVENDPRDLTVIGGLSYFGGPLSNYSMHAIVTAVNLIRKNPSKKIMVVANGGYNTKQSIGIYGKEPPAADWNERKEKEIQEVIYSKALPKPVEKANGQLTVDAYTFYYKRDGQTGHGIVLGHLENQQRTLALIKTTPEKLRNLEQKNLVGQIFTVRYDSESDRNKIEINNDHN